MGSKKGNVEAPGETVTVTLDTRNAQNLLIALNNALGGGGGKGGDSKAAKGNKATAKPQPKT